MTCFNPVLQVQTDPFFGAVPAYNCTKTRFLVPVCGTEFLVQCLVQIWCRLPVNPRQTVLFGVKKKNFLQTKNGFCKPFRFIVEKNVVPGAPALSAPR